MKLTAFKKQRPVTNLLPDSNYSLPPAQVRTGFLGLFNKKFSGNARKSFVKLVLAPLMDTRSIQLGREQRAKNEDEIAFQRSAKDSLKKWEKLREERGLSKFTKIRKVNGSDPHLELDLPILDIPKFNLEPTFSKFSPAPVPPQALEEFSNLMNSSGSELFKPGIVFSNSGISTDLHMLLNTCLIGVFYEYRDARCMMYLRLRIEKTEAEHLVSEDWMSIRPVDVYPLFASWVQAEYESKLYGKSAVSVSKIATTLPAHLQEDERIDKFGIGVTMGGIPIYIPSKLDNTEKYENMFTTVGSNPDGSFSLQALDPDLATRKISLPVNMPVLVDWVNYKFSYTNSQGRIEVMALEHVRKCNSSMAVNLMTSGRLKITTIQTWAMRFPTRIAMNAALNLYCLGKDLAALRSDPKDPYFWMASILSSSIQKGETVAQALTRIEGEYTRGAVNMSLYPTGLEFTSDNSSPAWAFVSRFISQLYYSMHGNLQSLYAQFAVSTITESLGWVSLLANYGLTMAVTRADAETINKAAVDQNVDPAWEPAEAPLVTKKFSQPNSGLLPHQAKIRNLLKDSPDNAVLSVDAGGGKSMLSITDVLYEIKAKRSAPYLIMCPAHLVANYVSEIVEFTDGMVNVIPVTSYNIRTSGYERFTQILEAAPINTILVVDYDALKFRARSAVYGTAVVDVFPVIELIRKFRPGYAMLDESHLLKNVNSARYKSVLSLIADIPKKRIASGTINPDSPSDLAGQVAILDPSIFGTREDFNEKFALGEYSGGRVREWKPDAGEVALSMIKRTCVWAQAKRKEWACALPRRKDRFLSVSLTDNQQIIYQALFDDMVSSIRKKAATDKNARKLLDGLTGKKASREDEDSFGDLTNDVAEDPQSEVLSEEDDIGASLQPYLAVIEQFVSDPAGHPYAINGFIDSNQNKHPPLSGDDLVSPKALALNQDLTDWVKNNKSKAIVFVNYHDTANALYNAMSPELQACGFVYQASQKVEMVNRFKTDSSVKWMIGIRKSLEVGLNLQVAGLLVRMEGCWTPGEQEQGDSRIARPFFGKGGDQRPMLQFDTIVANYTIDVTKAARLRAKIVGLAKFENARDERYANIQSIPVFSMTLENIKTKNDFTTELVTYEESMSQLNKAILEDYNEYRDRITAEGGFKFTPIPKASTPPEAAMLSRVPYAQGTELYSAEDLGLVRLDNFLGTELSAEEDEDEGGDDEDSTDENDLRQDVIREQLDLILGLRCHTEYGEGNIVAGAAGSSSFINRVRVHLDDGTTARNLRSTNVFVVTRTETNSIDMRQRLAKAAGLKVIGEITVPGNNLKITKITKKMQREEEQRLAEEQAEKARKVKIVKAGISLQLSLMNGYMRLTYVGDDVKMRKAIQAIGFKLDQPYVATRIRDHKHLIAQAMEWQKAGFNTSKEVDNDTLSWLAHELASGGLRNHKHYANVVQKGFQNYLRRIWKPSADKSLLHLFAIVTDGGNTDAANIRNAKTTGVDPNYGVAYLCLPYGAGFPSTKEAIKEAYRRPASKWAIHQGQLSMFVNSLDAVRAVFKDMLDAGITLDNRDELEMQAKSVKKIVTKTDKTLDLTI